MVGSAPQKGSPALQMHWHKRRKSFAPAYPKHRFIGVRGTPLSLAHRLSHPHPCALHAKAFCIPPPSETPDRPGSMQGWEEKGSRSKKPTRKTSKAPNLNLQANRSAHPQHPVNNTTDRALSPPNPPAKSPAACRMAPGWLHPVSRGKLIFPPAAACVFAALSRLGAGDRDWDTGTGATEGSLQQAGTESKQMKKQ